jgi:hypothetical protein
VSLWAEELVERENSVTVVSVTPTEIPLDGVEAITVPDDGPGEPVSRPSMVEDRLDIPSLDHLVWTERQYFDLDRERALARACRIADTYERLFEDHDIDAVVQVRGPEIHRLLAHYAVESAGGTSIWMDFSPFDDRFALSSAVDGRWDGYNTHSYDEMSDAECAEASAHIKEFREEQRFYAHDDDRDPDGNESTSDRSLLSGLEGRFREILNRDRPGRLRDQIKQSARLAANQRVNDHILPTVAESRRLCERRDYVFFPWQYHIESRLTVFSPAFFDQTWLLEYLARALPSSVELFVKGHPNHPGRPAPETIHRLREDGRVTFLAHDTNAHEVIERSEGVVVVNNTVGFETLYHGKPLFVLGSPPYAETPAAVDIEDVSKVPEALAAHIGTAVPEETTIESVHSLRAATYPGDRASYDSDDVAILINSVEQCLAERNGRDQ